MRPSSISHVAWGKRKEFLDLVCKEMIPAVKGLAKFCDVFCEVGVFTREESRKVLETGLDYGLLPKLHAEEFKSIGGAEMGAELGAISADHLVAISSRGMQAMKRKGTIAVVLPATTFFLGGAHYAPARRMIEYCEKHKIMWALDGKIEMPDEDELKKIPVENTPKDKKDAEGEDRKKEIDEKAFPFMIRRVTLVPEEIFHGNFSLIHAPHRSTFGVGSTRCSGLR